MMCSSRSLEATIAASGKPASSRICAGLDAQVGQVAGVEADAEHLVARWPQPAADLDGVADAFERVVGVDQEDAVVGHRLGVGRKASSSSSKHMTQLWACVPLTGMPKSRPARTFEVAAQPPT